MTSHSFRLPWVLLSALVTALTAFAPLGFADEGEASDADDDSSSGSSDGHGEDQGHGNDDDDDHGNGSAGAADRRGPRDDDEDDDGEGDEFRLLGKGVLGRFNISDQHVEGRFIAFDIDFASEDVANFEVGGVAVFDAISASAPYDEFKLRRDDHGAELKFEGDLVELKLHDNPAALIKLEAEHDHGEHDGDHDEDDDDGDAEHGEHEADADGANATFTLDLASGVAADQTGDRTVVLSWDNVTAVVHSNHDIALGNGTLEVTGETVFLVKEKRALLPRAANHHRDALDQALARGDIGAEITVLRAANDTLVTETVATRDLLVTVEDEEDGVSIVVDSAEHRGTVLVLAIDRDLLRDDLFVRFYDVSNNTTELPIRKASSLADVLDPTDDGLVAEYRLVKDEDGWQLIVSIPGFSAKRIQLQSTAAGLVPVLPLAAEHPALVVGALAAVAALGLAATAMFRRPRRET